MSKVEALAAQGLLQKEIAAALGIHVSTLCDKKNQYAEFSEAITRGQAKGFAMVTSKLMEQIQKGNVPAIIHFTKSRMGWTQETPGKSITIETDKEKGTTKVTLGDLYKQLNDDSPEDI